MEYLLKIVIERKKEYDEELLEKKYNIKKILNKYYNY